MIRWTSPRHAASTHRVKWDASLRSEQNLYHMLTWGHAKTIFEESRLRLSPVDSWDDPFEYWCRNTGVRATVRAYALCWTTHTFDEPLWRLAAFRRDDTIVRIRCSVQAILHAAQALNAVGTGTIYLGRVRYRRQRQLTQLAALMRNERAPARQAIADLFFKKRRAYRFEREVRLLWLDTDGNHSSRSVDIEPKTMITQVMISPYARSGMCDRIRTYVNKWNVDCVQSEILKRR